MDKKKKGRKREKERGKKGEKDDQDDPSILSAFLISEKKRKARRFLTRDGKIERTIEKKRFSLSFLHTR